MRTHKPIINKLVLMAQRAHILVVEDDPLVAEVVVDALQDLYDTSQAEDAGTGLARLHTGGIDLILLDCSLPGGLGDELIPAADGAGIPIILMSGNPEMAERVGGNRPFVLKPFALSALMDMIGVHLRSA